MMARGPQNGSGIAADDGAESDSEGDSSNVKESKIVMTELMSLLLKHSKDQQMLKVCIYDFVAIYIKETKKGGSAQLESIELIKGLLKSLQVAHSDRNMIFVTISYMQMLKAYQECFLLLTKTYYQSGNKKLIKFLAFTYKSLLKNFLCGRIVNAISVKLFQSAFEQNPGFSWKYMLKVILKSIASTKTKPVKASDELMAPEEQPKKKEMGEDGDGSRSNHQRLQAIELFGAMIKECGQNAASRELLYSNLDLIAQIVVRAIETSGEWKNKKVSKTIQVVNLFVKAAKVVYTHKDDAAVAILRKQGALIIKVINTECERDKALSNLKGKIKEIKAIIDHA